MSAGVILGEMNPRLPVVPVLAFPGWHTRSSIMRAIRCCLHLLSAFLFVPAPCRCHLMLFSRLLLYPASSSGWQHLFGASGPTRHGDALAWDPKEGGHCDVLSMAQRSSRGIALLRRPAVSSLHGAWPSPIDDPARSELLAGWNAQLSVDSDWLHREKILN